MTVLVATQIKHHICRIGARAMAEDTTSVLPRVPSRVTPKSSILRTKRLPELLLNVTGIWAGVAVKTIF